MYPALFTVSQETDGGGSDGKSICFCTHPPRVNGYAVPGGAVDTARRPFIGQRRDATGFNTFVGYVDLHAITRPNYFSVRS